MRLPAVTVAAAVLLCVLAVAAVPSSPRAAGRPGAVAARKPPPKRPGCGSRCRQLGATGGGDGICYSGVNPLTSAYASVASGEAVRLDVVGDPPSVGELLVAVVQTLGPQPGAVTPPPGWVAIEGADRSGPGQHLQLFERIVTAADLGPDGGSTPVYSFTTASPQHIVAALVDIAGVSPTEPIAAVASAASPGVSSTATAPSVVTSAPDSLLMYVGASPSTQTWKVPPGMKARGLRTVGDGPDRSPIVVATERFAPVAASGDRTAALSTPAASIGALVALDFPPPVGCPTMAVLSHTVRASRSGVVSVRLRCAWSGPCDGAFEGLYDGHDDPFPRIFANGRTKVAASDFSVPSGATRTVSIALTPAGRRYLQRHPSVPIKTYVWVYTARDPVLARVDHRTLVLASR